MDAPLHKDHRITIEYVIPSNGEGKHNQEKRVLNPVVIEEDNSITGGRIAKNPFPSRTSMNESITRPSRQMFIVRSVQDIRKNCEELNLAGPKVYDVAFNLVQKLVIANKIDVVVSKTAQGELLFYRKKHGAFSNIIIDEDADVSYLQMGTDNNEDVIRFFSHDSGLDYQEIVNLI